jgi:hypothetical protein
MGKDNFYKVRRKAMKSDPLASQQQAQPIPAQNIEKKTRRRNSVDAVTKWGGKTH